METEATPQTPAPTTNDGQQSATTNPADTAASAAAPGGEQQGQQQQQAAPVGAPEKYDFTAPEGHRFDDAMLAEFSEGAREANLTQESAQKLLDRIGSKLESRQAERMAEVATQWANDARADKEFGGEKFDENLGIAKKWLSTFGDAELTQLLNETGLGNHPAFIRAMWKGGQGISEDRLAGTGAGQQQQAAPTIAQRLYPNMNP